MPRSGTSKRLAAPKYFKSECHRSHNAPSLSAPWTTFEQTAALNGSVGRRAGLKGSTREGPESASGVEKAMLEVRRGPRRDA